MQGVQQEGQNSHGKVRVVQKKKEEEEEAAGGVWSVDTGEQSSVSSDAPQHSDNILVCYTAVVMSHCSHSGKT